MKARVIQAAWHRYKKIEKSMYAKQNILQDQEAKVGRKSSKFRVAIYTTRIFAYMHRSVRHSGDLPGGRVNVTLVASEIARS